MKKITITFALLCVGVLLHAQEQNKDSIVVTSLNEVVVDGYFGGLSKALKQQKKNLNITNVVTADQAGKYPDDNIGDAIKRISGISVQNDQGEARNIVMRGFGTQLNSVTLNGDRLPSAEGDNRNVQLDLIPTNMIEAIVVKKSLTPDMEGDAIGGSVNLITRSNPSEFRASATLSGGGNPIRDGGYNANFGLVVADKLSDKFSYTFSSTIQTRDYGSDNVEFAWNDPADWADINVAEIEEMDIRRYDVKRTRRSVSLNLDYNFNENNSLFFKSIYNHRDDWENRFRWRAQYEDQELKVRKQTKGGIDNDENDSRRLEDQRLEKYSLGGEHQAGNLAIDWKVSTAKASEHRPDERYTRYEYKGIPYAGNSPWDISNPERPYLNFADDSWND
ncbi:MAG: TonB-dependent receptor plug domain-containing protein, partial [Flavobacteriaceae bacterium]